jgi:hypothetical protein
MTSETFVEVAEAVAPTWERRRADVELLFGPVREWMLRELAPRDGDTVLELAAGAGDTGLRRRRASWRARPADLERPLAMLDAARGAEGELSAPRRCGLRGAVGASQVAVHARVRGSGRAP